MNMLRKITIKKLLKADERKIENILGKTKNREKLIIDLIEYSDKIIQKKPEQENEISSKIDCILSKYEEIQALFCSPFAGTL